MAGLLAAVAAPAAGGVGLGLASFVLFACAVVMLGLQRGWRTSLGRFLTAFADLLDRISVSRVRPFGSLAAWVRRQVAAVDHALGQAALALMDSATYMFDKAWRTILWTVREIADLAVTVEQALWAQRHRIADTLLLPLRAFVDLQLRLIRKAIAATDASLDFAFGKARRGIDALTKRLDHTLNKELARVRSRVGSLEKTIAGWKAHPGRLVDVLGAAGAVALFGVMAKALKIGWIRCGNAKRVGNFLCRDMRADLLEDLLLGVVTLTVGLNIVTFAEEMGEVVGETADFIHNAVT